MPVERENSVSVMCVGIRNSDHDVDLQVRKKRENVPGTLLMDLSMSTGNGAIGFLNRVHPSRGSGNS